MVTLEKKTMQNSYKSAQKLLSQKNLLEQKVQVGLVMDISKSMYPLFKSGIVQTIIERVLALALHFDDDYEIDMFLFGTKAYMLHSVTLHDFEGYVEREILPYHKINGATKYAKALEVVKEAYQEPEIPVFIIFLTDGNNSDKSETNKLIKELSHKPLFFQFVGIGKEKFPYLERLDELKGRFLDNAGYTHVNDINTISDEELYQRILEEFPDWLNSAQTLF